MCFHQELFMPGFMILSHVDIHKHKPKGDYSNTCLFIIVFKIVVMVLIVVYNRVCIDKICCEHCFWVFACLCSQIWILIYAWFKYWYHQFNLCYIFMCSYVCVIYLFALVCMYRSFVYMFICCTFAEILVCINLYSLWFSICLHITIIYSMYCLYMYYMHVFFVWFTLLIIYMFMLSCFRSYRHAVVDL